MISDFPGIWRLEAQRLRDRYGLEELARLTESHAAELEAAIREAGEEELTLSAASQESDYAARTLREKLSKGEIPNAGRKHAPRIKRADLPRRARAAAEGWDPAEHVRSIVGDGR